MKIKVTLFLLCALFAAGAVSADDWIPANQASAISGIIEKIIFMDDNKIGVIFYQDTVEVINDMYDVNLLSATKENGCLVIDVSKMNGKEQLSGLMLAYSLKSRVEAVLAKHPMYPFNKNFRFGRHNLKDVNQIAYFTIIDQ